MNSIFSFNILHLFLLAEIVFLLSILLYAYITFLKLFRKRKNKSISYQGITEENNTFEINNRLLSKSFRKSLKIVLGTSFVVSLPLLLPTLAYLLMALMFYITPNPPAPKYDYGEFPIHIEYKIGNQLHEVDDVVKCKLEVTTNANFVKSNGWHIELKSGNDDLILYRKSEDEMVVFTTDAPMRYMNNNCKSLRDLMSEKLVYEIKYDSSVYDENIIKEKTGVEIIEWNYIESDIKLYR